MQNADYGEFLVGSCTIKSFQTLMVRGRFHVGASHNYGNYFPDVAGWVLTLNPIYQYANERWSSRSGFWTQRFSTPNARLCCVHSERRI